MASLTRLPRLDVLGLVSYGAAESAIHMLNLRSSAEHFFQNATTCVFFHNFPSSSYVLTPTEQTPIILREGAC